MRRYEITLKPKSAFGTALKGDSLFGQFCWQVAYDPGLVSGGIQELTRHYPSKPFAVFSSAFPKMNGDKTEYFFPRPAYIKADDDVTDRTSRKKALIDRKNMRACRWMASTKGESLDALNGEFLNDADMLKRFLNKLPTVRKSVFASVEAGGILTRFSQPHNSINRLTGSTGQGTFAPFSKENLFYIPGTELALFVLVDDDMTDIDRVVKGMERIGSAGFGRDASTGLGRFDILGFEDWELPAVKDSDGMFTLGPVVPPKQEFQNVFFSPFVRFGKHGDRLATGVNPFKKPIIMADEGAVFKPADPTLLAVPWIGTAVTDISYVEPETVAQGYAPWLPVKWEL